MKMKRMFGKKKKLANKSGAIYDSKTMDTISECAHPADMYDVEKKKNNRKNQRSRKKRKSKNHKKNNMEESSKVPDNATIAYQTADGTTRVTLRPATAYQSDCIAPRNRKVDEKRILGSESSSRTASSASSSSSKSRPRSCVRPWSLVEPQRGKSLSDLERIEDSDLSSFDLNNSTSPRHNLTAPTICTLPRNVYLEQEEFQGKRSRSFALDFSFLRRFKRSATSPASSTSKRLSASQLFLPQLSKDQQKNSKKDKKSKKKTDSFETKLVSDETSAPSPTSQTSFQQKELQRTINYDLNSVCEVPPEEVPGHPRHLTSLETTRSRKRSGSAAAHAAECNLNDEEQRFRLENADNDGSNNEKVNRKTRCDQCQKLQSGYRRSVCYCSSNPHIMHKDSVSRPIQSQTELNSAKNTDVLSTISPTSSLNDFKKNNFSATTERFYGGSMTNISSTGDVMKPLSKQKESKFSLFSTKGSTPYASSPQVNHSRLEEVSVHKEKFRTSSGKRRLASDKSKSFASLTPSMSQSDVAAAPIFVINSPERKPTCVKAGEVVLRRDHNRKNGHESSSGSFTSGGLMTREDRAMQVMSLNVEDLPTYGMMRDGVKWRRSTISSQKRITLKMSNDGDITHQSLLTMHCTSADDISKFDEVGDMDDDEYLDFCLGAGRERSKTQHHEAASIKTVRNFRKSVVSIANLISPAKPGKKPQRSPSYKEDGNAVSKIYRPPGSNNSGSTVVASYRPPDKRGKGSNTKNRHSKLWSQTYDHSGLEEGDIKRQEAIYELYQGERIMVEDLKMAKQTYRDSMITLKMLTEDEVTKIFGKLDCLLPLHENLLRLLQHARKRDGITECVGRVFIDWFPSLSPYDEYCANQADAKETLDLVVNREERVRDFLQRCLDSPFSRKLDLWSYLDLPRSRLVKYPLLLKAIHKVTPPHHQDSRVLEEAIEVINGIISRVDNLTGERQAKFVKSKLEYLDDKQKCPEVESSRKIVCSGQLKSSRGTKLQVFLFDRALVLTRNATRGEKLTYQVYRQPVPLKHLVVETDEGGKLSGSFRGSLLSSDKAKHSFKVKSDEMNISYTLIATDEHDKKQWLNSIQEAINKCRMAMQESTNPPTKPIKVQQEQQKKEKTSAVNKLEKKMSLKRTSSVKSDNGNGNSWYRNRSLTVSNFHGRRSSKGKMETSDDVSQSNLSSSSRHSRPSLLDLFTGSETPRRKFSLDDKTDWRRSRSLNSSPIAFLANLPKRKPRNGSGLGRSESCYTKPPIGRVATFNGMSSRSSTKTSKSPKTGSSQSIPDLLVYDRRRSNSDHGLTLEAVRNRLAYVSSQVDSSINLLLKRSTVCTSSKKVRNSEAVSPASSHVSVDTLDNQSSSSTSSHSTPANEENSKSVEVLKFTSDSLPPVSSDDGNQCPSIPTLVSPSIEEVHQRLSVDATLPISTQDIHLQSKTSTSSCESHANTSSNTYNAAEAISKKEIVEEINKNNCFGDLAFDTMEDNFKSDVATILNKILNEVCEPSSITDDSPLNCPVNMPSCKNTPLPSAVPASCNNDYITLTSDEGLPWDGNDIELMV